MEQGVNTMFLRRLSPEDLEALTRLVTRLVMEVVQGLQQDVPRPGLQTGSSAGASGRSGDVVTVGGPASEGGGEPTFTAGVLCEADVKAVVAGGARRLVLGPRVVVTPLALDTAKEKGLLIEREA